MGKRAYGRLWGEAAESATCQRGKQQGEGSPSEIIFERWGIRIDVGVGEDEMSQLMGKEDSE